MNNYSKPLLFIIMLIVINQTSFSQVRFGLKGGLNAAYTRFDNEDKSLLFRYNLGVFNDVKLSNKIYFRSELLYSIKGYRDTRLASNILRYVSLPTLIGFRASKNFSFLVGVETSYLSSAVITFKSERQNFTNSTERWDLGIDIGMLYQITNRLGVDLRYNWGLSKVYKTNAVSYDQITNILTMTPAESIGRNSVVQLNLNYFITKQK